jgi:hypothetical protein
MRAYAAALIALALAVAAGTPLGVASCGGSDTGDGGHGGGNGGAGAGGSATTEGGGFGGTPMTPKDSCVQPGGKGNNHGVGTYCTPGGEQCQKYPLAGLCLADVGQDQWFCSLIGCTKDKDCGDDAICLMMDNTGACIPADCAPDTTSSGGGGAGGATASGSGGSGGSIITP